MKHCKSRFLSLLKHKLILQEEVQTVDGVGGFVRTWKDVATLWASIEPIGGKETLRSKQLQAEVTHRLIMRYTPAIKAGMRFLHQTRALNIRLIHNLAEENKTMEVLVAEGDF